MSKFVLLFSIVMLVQLILAWDENIDEQLNDARRDSLVKAYLFAKNPWILPYFYQQSYIPGMNEI